ncbi:MAG: hypothetical protein F4X20_01625 [Dehalococcoidia bacterium]|nr:hypothetical protein [Dehalococcoidia bacterium]
MSKRNPVSLEVQRAVRLYVDAYVLRRGRVQTAAHLDVSRHTLWRFLDRRSAGHAVTQAVIGRYGENPGRIDEARYAILAEPTISFDPRQPEGISRPLRQTLLMLCRTPLITVEDLSELRGVPPSTLHDRLRTLKSFGYVESVQHRLRQFGPRPQVRWYPTQEGIIEAAGDGKLSGFVRAWPVSRQWFQLLSERLDSIAVIYRIAAKVAIADVHGAPVRFDHYRSGPYDALLTMSDSRSLGIVRQGPMLSAANLRYRIRSLGRMNYFQRPKTTLIVTPSDQATRRALRLLSRGYEDTFVATESRILNNSTSAMVWQQGGILDFREQLSTIVRHASLDDILDTQDEFIRDPNKNHPIPAFPIPDLVYDHRVVATMPAPEKQLASSLSILLTRAEKDALNVLADWPLCTTEQLAGLLGGVTKRRANQLVQSLKRQGLIHSTEHSHVLREKALTYLSRRDRAAVGQTLDRWSSEPFPDGDTTSIPYLGTALRTMEAQPHHHAGITDFAATLTAKAKFSRDYDVRFLLPTARSQITYSYDVKNHVLMPDASFQLAFRGDWHTYFLEFERRATTLKRVTERLQSYIRYFKSDYARKDHGGRWPRVLFIFESDASESNFMLATRKVSWAPFLSTTTDILAKRGPLASAWRHASQPSTERHNIEYFR